MFVIERGVFDAGHQFHAMFSKMVVQTEVAGLIKVAAAQVCFALLTALCAQTLVTVAARKLVTGDGLQSPNDKKARL